MSVAEDPQRAENRDRAEDAHRRLLEGAKARALAETGTIRVERVIVGGGLAATLCWATGARCEGLVVARAEEPWWSRGHWRLGQPASELVSEGFVLQPHEFAEDVDGFAPARALADRKSRGRDPLRARLEQQVEAAPTCSRGIENAVFHVGANVTLANATPLDPGLGEERYELLLSTFRQHQGDLATSRGDGG